MAKSRTVVGGPRWPRNAHTSSAPAHFSPGTLDALNEEIIVIGQVQSDDGASHAYDTIEFRAQTGFTGTLRVGFADVDVTTGPPGRHDGTIDQFADQVNPANATVYSLTLSASRTLAHGDLIAVVFKAQAYTAGGFVLHTLLGQTGPMRPQLTTFLGGAYANAGGFLPAFSLHASGDGHYAVLKGCMPVLTATVATVNLNNAAAIRRAGLGFTVAAPVWGIEGCISIQNVAGGDFDIRLYDDDVQIASMTVDANTWGADAQWRPVEFCFPDVALTSGNNYRLVVVPTTATNVTIYTGEVTTPERYDPLTGRDGGGTFGYVTHDGTNWSALDESVMPLWWQWLPVAVDDAAGAGGGHKMARVRLGH